MKFVILEKTFQEKMITYTGVELRPHWCLEKTGVYGSIITAFLGPCEVKTEHLVDWEDKLAHDFIRADQMLHFIGEWFGGSLESAVLYQRLFIVWTQTLLMKRGVQCTRIGDDLFIQDKKFSVSIATISPVSTLIHWGLNVNSNGAPVSAIGFKDLGFSQDDVLSFAKELLTHYCEEIKDIHQALCKVKPV